MIKTQDSPDVAGFHSVTVTGDAEGHLVTTYDPPESAPPVLPNEYLVHVSEVQA